MNISIFTSEVFYTKAMIILSDNKTFSRSREKLKAAAADIHNKKLLNEIFEDSACVHCCRQGMKFEKNEV